MYINKKKFDTTDTLKLPDLITLSARNGNLVLRKYSINFKNRFALLPEMQFCAARNQKSCQEEIQSKLVCKSSLQVKISLSEEAYCDCQNNGAGENDDNDEFDDGK